MQIAGNVSPVTIIPKSGKSSGTITIFYNGSTTIPQSFGTYIVTFNVAASTGWNAVTGLHGGILTINQTPLAEDFNFGNLTQTVGIVTAVNITPKDGKSTGTITIFYNGSITIPQSVGTYTVTFNVAASTGWNIATGLYAGLLTVNNQVHAQTPSIISQPSSSPVVFNASHNLSVIANITAGGTLSYQWYSNMSASNIGGSIISGATAHIYSPPTNTAGTFYYFVEITNTISDNGDGGNKIATIRSNAISLIVNAQVNAQTPSITSQPINATLLYNATHSLSVTSTVSGGSLSYQWYSNMSASDIGGSIISGATARTYSLPTSTAGTFYYFVEITNTVNDNGDGGNKTATVKSNVVTVIVQEPQGNINLIITFNQITDIAISLTGPTLYRVSNGGPTSSTLTLANPSQYESINWRVGTTDVVGTGNSFTISASNPAYNLIGEHFVTVKVVRDGVPYNRTVSFKVEY